MRKKYLVWMFIDPYEGWRIWDENDGIGFDTFEEAKTYLDSIRSHHKGSPLMITETIEDNGLEES